MKQSIDVADLDIQTMGFLWDSIMRERFNWLRLRKEFVKLDNGGWYAWELFKTTVTDRVIVFTENALHAKFVKVAPTFSVEEHETICIPKVALAPWAKSRSVKLILREQLESEKFMYGLSVTADHFNMPESH